VKPLAILALIIAAVIAAVAPFPIVWKPWVSPDYAAKMLVEDDGKGVVFWLPSAARFWGYRTYASISNYTNRFQRMDRNPLVFTLIDMLEREDRPMDDVFIGQLLGSPSVNAKLVGCYAAEAANADAAKRASCRQMVRSVLTRKPDVNNQIEIATALRVVGKSRMPGMSGDVVRLALDPDAPYGVRVQACIAAAKVPESEGLAALNGLDSAAWTECNKERGPADQRR